MEGSQSFFSGSPKLDACDDEVFSYLNNYYHIDKNSIEDNIRNKVFSIVTVGTIRTGSLVDLPEARRVTLVSNGVFLLTTNNEIVFFDFRISQKYTIGTIQEKAWGISVCENELFVEGISGQFTVYNVENFEIVRTFKIDPSKRPSVILNNQLVIFCKKHDEYFIKTYTLNGEELLTFPLSNIEKALPYLVTDSHCYYYDPIGKRALATTPSGDTEEIKLPFEPQNIFLLENQQLLINQSNQSIEVLDLKTFQLESYKSFCFDECSTVCISDDFLMVEHCSRAVIIIDRKTHEFNEFEELPPHILSLHFHSGRLVADSLFHGISFLDFNSNAESKSN